MFLFLKIGRFCYKTNSLNVIKELRIPQSGYKYSELFLFSEMEGLIFRDDYNR